MNMRNSLVIYLSAVIGAAGCAREINHAPVNAPELPVYRTADLTPHWPGIDLQLDDRDNPDFPKFQLTDQAGRPFANRDLSGHIVVASFFYSRCSDLCPRLRSSLSQVRAAFAGDSRLLLVSHSITPNTDTPEMLAAYAKTNQIDGAGWKLLTGPAPVIEALEHQGYLVPRARSDQPAMHSEMLVLLDPHQRVRGVYNGTLQTELGFLERDIRALEK